MTGRRPGRAGLDTTEPGCDGTDHRGPYPAAGGRSGRPEVDFTDPRPARHDEAGAIELGFPHPMLASDHIRNMTAGDLRIETRG
ncbi:hypothetical protein GCM10011588_26360 [Nocardia jinanensis]|uniref:Uncharacterized protein n=1 Tax=Nocardia jinanensis TaxID=382504 RepID=A0A917RJE6_9NOCA|nr:hypothetical protein GCM10011588_26360 [Nocardia jinanensis]